MTALVILPEVCTFSTLHLMDWKPAQVVKANPLVLKAMKKGRSRQSELSKKRQSFITGMAVYRMTDAERSAKLAYIEEWHFRVSDNEW